MASVKYALAPRLTWMTKFKLGYRPPLDGLRGLSVLAVMAMHFGVSFAKGGGYGVDVFFVLSGFLITALLLQEWDRTGRISLKDFYIRRALRLLPALTLLLAAFCLYSTLFLDTEEARTNYKYTLAALFYSANWVRAFGHTMMGALGHTWSLSIEEQFYLIWPPLLLVMLRYRVRLRKILYLLLAGVIVVAIHRALLWHGEPSFYRTYNGLDTRADDLLIGCAVAILAVSGLLPKISLLAIPAAIIVVIAVVVGMSDAAFLGYGGVTVFAGLVALVLVSLLTKPPGIVSLILECAPLVWVGRLSYSLYLWHYPVLEVVGNPSNLSPRENLLLRLTLSFVAAILSYYAVERPFLRLKDRFSRIKSRLPAPSLEPTSVTAATAESP